MTDERTPLTEELKSKLKMIKMLAEMPPNECTPQFLADYATDVANNSEHMTIEDLDQDGMFKLLGAVNKGSLNPCYMLKMTYKHPNAFKQPIVLIGKGITFDTGGLDIKTRDMWEMKFDMCGAATVIATMAALSSNNTIGHVVGLIPMTENMIGPDAILPGSVVTTHAGVSVEITDTDAEGRLILADALQYACDELNPLCIIDMATLTGACASFLGSIHHGLWGNNETLIEALREIGTETKDLVWPMPLHIKHTKSLKSHVADIKNYKPGGEASACAAAAFLSHFVPEEVPWAHLDIAGTAWKGEKATGRPLHLILQFLEEYTNNTV
jgi:leucyl aminopeptidase